MVKKIDEKSLAKSSLIAVFVMLFIVTFFILGTILFLTGSGELIEQFSSIVVRTNVSYLFYNSFVWFGLFSLTSAILIMGFVYNVYYRNIAGIKAYEDKDSKMLAVLLVAFFFIMFLMRISSGVNDVVSRIQARTSFLPSEIAWVILGILMILIIFLMIGNILYIIFVHKEIKKTRQYIFLGTVVGLIILKTLIFLLPVVTITYEGIGIQDFCFLMVITLMLIDSILAEYALIIGSLIYLFLNVVYLVRFVLLGTNLVFVGIDILLLSYILVSIFVLVYSGLLVYRNLRRIYE